jgi:hypothetical protein
MGMNEPNTDQAPSKATLARRRNAQARRDRVLGEGGRRLELLLQPDAAQALIDLEQKTGGNATQVISGLLLRSAKRRR